MDGKITLDSRKIFNRAGLLIQDGVLYIAFGAHGDGEPRYNYHGWILAIDAHNLHQFSSAVHHARRYSRRHLAKRGWTFGGTPRRHFPGDLCRNSGMGAPAEGTSGNLSCSSIRVNC